MTNVLQKIEDINGGRGVGFGWCTCTSASSTASAGITTAWGVIIIVIK
jgi:hypothetical protein